MLLNVFLHFSYAKQLIEETIRRNASPVRLEAPQGGSCSSLASSASDEALPRGANRNSANMSSSNTGGVGVAGVAAPAAYNNSFNVSNQSSMNNGGGSSFKLPRAASGGQLLLHSLSTNDASLGEYKYTVGVGQHNIKITGECFELVRVSR